jgi:energy-coupling factor transport system ATP-binding protein
MAIARVDHLTYWYPRSAQPALDGVDLVIDDGITVVVGPSGGGKSTLLRVLNGLVPHFHGGRIKGSADVAGQNIIETPTRQLARTVGFVSRTRSSRRSTTQSSTRSPSGSRTSE